MLLKPEPVFAAVADLRKEGTKVILTTPQGLPFKQENAQKLSSSGHLIFICGHYEGVDHRIVDHLVDEEISIGDYVLTNGALAAAVVCDAIIRLLPGALGDDRSPAEESFSNPDLLEPPAYTKPIDFMGLKVPEILLSGNHAAIEEWKQKQALERTRRNRPDLIDPSGEGA